MISKYFSFNNKSFIINLLLIIVYIITLYPLTKISFTMGDDIDLYLECFRGHFSNLSNIGYEQGRFYQVFMRYIFTIPYLVDSPYWFYFFYITPIALSFIIFIRLISRIFKNESITLFVALFFASSFQIMGFHSITTGYPFFFTSGFCILLLSFHLFLSYYDNRKKSIIIFSALLMFIATLFYESFLSYYLVILFICVWKNNILNDYRKKNIITSLKDLSPFIVAGIIYLILYFGFQYFYPSQYNGAKIAKDITLWGIIKTATTMSLYSFPLQVFSDYRGLLERYSLFLDGSFLKYRIELIYIIEGCIIAFMTFYSMTRYIKIRNKALIYCLATGLFLTYIPLIFLSISDRYYLANWKSYVPTFFSFFGYGMCFVAIIFLINNLISKNKYLKKIFSICVAFSLFVITIYTQSLNKAVAEDIHKTSLRLELVKDTFRKNALKDIDSNTPICFEQVHNTTSIISGIWVTKQFFTWKKFILRTTNKEINTKEGYLETLESYKNSDTKLWIAYFRQNKKTDDAILFYAQQKGCNLPQSQNELTTNKIIGLYLSPYKEYNISLATLSDNSDTVFINDYPMNKIGNYHTLNVQFDIIANRKTTAFEIRGNNIIASSLNINNNLDSYQGTYLYSIANNKEDLIIETIRKIERDSAWINKVKLKAQENKISLRRQLIKEAEWIVNQEK